MEFVPIDPSAMDMGKYFWWVVLSGASCFGIAAWNVWREHVRNKRSQPNLPNEHV